MNEDKMNIVLDRKKRRKMPGICYACGTAYGQWRPNYDSRGDGLCHRCFKTIIYKPAKFKSMKERNEWRRHYAKLHPPPNAGIHLVDKLNRQCYACGNDKTYIDSFGKRHWILNKNERGNILHVLCNRCFKFHIYNKSDAVKRYQSLRIRFRGKTITLSRPLRKGVCRACGARTTTHIHHEMYDDNDPAAHTVELCPKCHLERGRQSGQIQRKRADAFTKISEA